MLFRTDKHEHRGSCVITSNLFLWKKRKGETDGLKIKHGSHTHIQHEHSVSHWLNIVSSSRWVCSCGMCLNLSSMSKLYHTSHQAAYRVSTAHSHLKYSVAIAHALDTVTTCEG